MALYRTEGIVLKASDFGEAHRIVTLLTPGRGKLRAVAKGVRRPTSRLAAALLPFTHSRLLLWEGRSLDGISQAEIRQSFRPLREDLGRMASALYACELVSEVIPEGPGAEREGAAAFRLLRDTLGHLAWSGRPDLALRYLELHLLRLSGHFPQLDACAACGGPVELPAWFHPAAGGCLCVACRVAPEGPARNGGPRRPAPEADARWLGRAAQAAARTLLAAPAREVPRLPVPAAAARSLGALVEACFRALLQKRLKSAEFLDILSPAPGSPAADARPDR